MTRRIFDDSERDIIDDLLNNHGLKPKDIADKWDTSTCVVYKQLNKWGVNWLDDRKNNKRPSGRVVTPSKAIRILDVASRTLWDADRIALHCGTSISYTKQVLTGGLPEHYTSRSIHIKEAKEKVAIVKRLISEKMPRHKAALSVGWSVYKYKYWLSELNKKAAG